MKNQKNKRAKNYFGFTLLEVLLSVAIIAALAAVGTPVYQSFQNRNDLDVAANMVVQSMRQAQVLSRAVKSDAPWGVHIDSSGVTLFQGSSYAGRISGFDEFVDFAAIESVTGVTEVVFSKLLGLPDTTGSLNLNGLNGGQKTITLNSHGTVGF